MIFRKPGLDSGVETHPGRETRRRKIPLEPGRVSRVGILGGRKASCAHGQLS